MGTKERRDRDKQRRREDILGAARTLLLERGYEHTTIDDIARSAELAKGTIYLYFQSKEEIYVAIVDDGLDVLMGLITDSFDAASDPMTNLLAALDAGLSFDKTYAHYEEFMLFKSMSMRNTLPAELKERFDDKTGKIFAYFTKIIEDGIESGAFRPMVPQRAAMLVLGMAFGCNQLMSDAPDEIAADADSVREDIHALIANSIAIK